MDIQDPVCDPIDTQPGRQPVVRASGQSVTFEMSMLPTATFKPTPWTRLVIRADRDNVITLRIREGRV